MTEYEEERVQWALVEEGLSGVKIIEGIENVLFAGFIDIIRDFFASFLKIHRDC